MVNDDSKITYQKRDKQRRPNNSLGAVLPVQTSHLKRRRKVIGLDYPKPLKQTMVFAAVATTECGILGQQDRLV